jgi:hypothetical protein
VWVKIFTRTRTRRVRYASFLGLLVKLPSLTSTLCMSISDVTNGCPPRSQAELTVYDTTIIFFIATLAMSTEWRLDRPLGFFTLSTFLSLHNILYVGLPRVLQPAIAASLPALLSLHTLTLSWTTTQQVHLWPKIGPRAWYSRYATYLLSLGFVEAKSDTSLFIY